MQPALELFLVVVSYALHDCTCLGHFLRLDSKQIVTCLTAESDDQYLFSFAKLQTASIHVTGDARMKLIWTALAGGS